MPLVVVNGPTIPAGEFLSEAIDCSGGTLVRITVPSEWTEAVLSFQVSSDDAGYNDLFTGAGNEVVLAPRPGIGIMVPSDWARTLGFVKFRSGTRDQPVKQKADRTFAVALEILEVRTQGR